MAICSACRVSSRGPRGASACPLGRGGRRRRGLPGPPRTLPLDQGMPHTSRVFVWLASAVEAIGRLLRAVRGGGFVGFAEDRWVLTLSRRCLSGIQYVRGWVWVGPTKGPLVQTRLSLSQTLGQDFLCVGGSQSQQTPPPPPQL